MGLLDEAQEDGLSRRNRLHDSENSSFSSSSNTSSFSSSSSTSSSVALLSVAKAKRRFRARFRKKWRAFTWLFAALFLTMLTIYTATRDHHQKKQKQPDKQQQIYLAESSDFELDSLLLTVHSSSEPVFYSRTLLQQVGGINGTLAELNVAPANHNHNPKNGSEKEAKNKTKNNNFPEDLFSEEQREHGAIIFHIIGLVYMFVALAIVCDEFFIPALDVITEKLQISEDVAGATFMAAGGSAPELFTSIIGVFISGDDVGIGTIVGSAVFNILFVLSMCAIFSKSVLELTWWPLFRDVSFYSLILITLVLCFKDSWITWYEALILLIWYGAYVTFMKFNEVAEKFVKRLFGGARVDKVEVETSAGGNGAASGGGGGITKADSVQGPPPNYQFTRKMSTPILHGGSKFRQGVLQLMIHSIDPLYEEPLSLAMKNGQAPGEVSKEHIHPPGAAYCPICGEEKHSMKLQMNANGVFHTAKTLMTNNGSGNGTVAGTGGEDAVMATHGNGYVSREVSMEEPTPEPLDVSWPTTNRKRLTYLLLAPIIFPLWLTVPDVRRPEKKKFFALAFLGSIIWIAIYSYLMVWWATLVGECFGMPAEVMGLTFLAAGTSIPDLITSVLVARKGLGDMAVSSSIGSNIFDVAVGLPLPWFMFTCVYGSVKVTSEGMICSVILLFLMLLFVILTIAVFNWRLNIGMAVVMFILYFIFIAISLLLEKGIIDCAKYTGF